MNKFYPYMYSWNALRHGRFQELKNKVQFANLEKLLQSLIGVFNCYFNKGELVTYQSANKKKSTDLSTFMLILHTRQTHFSITQNNTTQHNTVQYNVMQYHTLIQCNAMQYNKIQYNTVQYNVTQCKYNTTHYDTIQCNAMQYTTIQYNAMQCNTIWSKPTYIVNRNPENLLPSCSSSTFNRPILTFISPSASFGTSVCPNVAWKFSVWPASLFAGEPPVISKIGGSREP